MDPNVVVSLTMVFVVIMAIVGDQYFRYQDRHDQKAEKSS